MPYGYNNNYIGAYSDLNNSYADPYFQNQMQTPQEPSGAQQIAGTLGNLGGTYAGKSLYSYLAGDSAVASVPTFGSSGGASAFSSLGADTTLGSSLGTETAASTGSGLSGAGSTLSTYAIPAASVLATLDGGRRLYGGISKGNRTKSAIGGAEAGAGIGTLILPGVGTLIGAGIGALAGGGLGHIKTGKSAVQQSRDSFRKSLKQSNVIDNNYNIKLADGSLYDIGKDGGFKLTNTDGSKRNAYDVDFSDKRAGQAVGWANPLAALFAGGDSKKRSDLAGYFTNAALSNAKNDNDIRANFRGIADKLGGANAINEALKNFAGSGELSQQEIAVMQNGINTLYNNKQKKK